MGDLEEETSCNPARFNLVARSKASPKVTSRYRFLFLTRSSLVPTNITLFTGGLS